MRQRRASIKLGISDYGIRNTFLSITERKEGVAHKVAVIACANKMLHWIYGVLTRGGRGQPAVMYIHARLTGPVYWFFAPFYRT